MTTTKKYQLIRSTAKRVDGHTVYRIRALRDFGNVGMGTGVKKGDRGGYIQKHANLSHSGKAWIFDNAKVFGDAKVSGNALIFGNAWIFGEARVYGDAEVSDNAWVYGKAKVFGDAMITDKARVYDTTNISNGRWFR